MRERVFGASGSDSNDAGGCGLRVTAPQLQNLLALFDLGVLFADIVNEARTALSKCLAVCASSPLAVASR